LYTHNALTLHIAGIRIFKGPFCSKGKVRLNLRGVNHARPRSRIGDFSGPSSARGAMCPGVLASRASEGQGGLWARGLNRMGSGIGEGSGQLESKARAGARGGARAGKPRWVRILAIAGGCSMEAMSFKAPRTGNSVPYRSRRPVYESPPWLSPFGPAPFKTAPGSFVRNRAHTGRRQGRGRIVVRH